MSSKGVPSLGDFKYLECELRHKDILGGRQQVFDWALCDSQVAPEWQVSMYPCLSGGIAREIAMRTKDRDCVLGSESVRSTNQNAYS